MKSAGVVLFGMLLCGSSVAAVSQNAPQYTGRIEGSVIATEQLTGLAGVLVTLVPVAVAAQPPENGNGERAGPDTRSQTTGATGEYGFESLPPGKYTLRITREGYLPAEIDVELARGCIEIMLFMRCTIFRTVSQVVSTQPGGPDALKDQSCFQTGGSASACCGTHVRRGASAGNSRLHAGAASDLR